MRSRAAVGILLVVISTVAIAIVPSLARLAYDGGSNPLTVITVRSIVSALVGLMVLLASAGWAQISREALLACLAAGVCYAIMLYGFLAAVRYLPVNTVILIYFVHPIVLAVVAARLGDERVTGPMLLALAAALGGLTLAVGLSLERPSFIGLALAVTAMVTCVLVLLLSGRVAKLVGGSTMVFLMMLSASAVLGSLFLLVGEPRLPANPAGWLGFLGVAVCSTLGTFTFFCAVPMIGVVRATMISNLEPLLGILFAVALLGEVLSWPQIMGIVLVLASIVAMERFRQPA
jgi:drug/metabolite transporter (DMT)-like permease